MKISSALIFAGILIGMISCQTKNEKDAGSDKVVEKPRIASVNYPIYYFSQRIGDAGIIATFPLPGDIDPAFFNPSAEELVAFQNADIIFLNGAGYESWIEKVSLPERRFSNTSQSFSDRYIKEEGAITHTHGPEGEHAHESLAFTTWLDMRNAKDQATNVYSALRALTPDGESLMSANYEVLAQQLDSLHSSLKKILDPFIGATVYASHPVYQYLGSGYGLTIKSEHWEPDQDISDEDWEHFQESVEPDDLKLMLWEGIPSESTANRLREAGFEIVLYYPCGNVPEEGDFIEVMKQNIENLKKGLGSLDLNP